MRRHHPSSSRAGRGGVQRAASRPSGCSQPLCRKTTGRGEHAPGSSAPSLQRVQRRAGVMLFYLLVSNPIMMRLRLLSVINQRCVWGLLKMASVLHFTVNSAPSRPPVVTAGVPTHWRGGEMGWRLEPYSQCLTVTKYISQVFYQQFFSMLTHVFENMANFLKKPNTINKVQNTPYILQNKELHS